MHLYIEVNDHKFVIALLDRQYGTGFRHIIATI